MKLTVDLGPNSYPIHIENGILAKTGELVRYRKLYRKSLLRKKNHDRFR